MKVVKKQTEITKNAYQNKWKNYMKKITTKKKANLNRGIFDNMLELYTLKKTPRGRLSFKMNTALAPIYQF